MKIESFTNGENMTVEHELIKATGIGKAGGEPREAFLKRLLKSVDEAIRKNPDLWAEFSEQAQDWVNAASENHNAQEPIPEFQDSEEVGEGAAPPKQKPTASASQPRRQKNIGVTIHHIKLTSAASMSATASLLRPRNGSGI
jgi:hypothetical protein